MVSVNRDFDGYFVENCRLEVFTRLKSKQKHCQIQLSLLSAVMQCTSWTALPDSSLSYAYNLT